MFAPHLPGLRNFAPSVTATTMRRFPLLPQLPISEHTELVDGEGATDLRRRTSCLGPGCLITSSTSGDRTGAPLRSVGQPLMRCPIGIELEELLDQAFQGNGKDCPLFI